jgi:hypothetical protein
MFFGIQDSSYKRASSLLSPLLEHQGRDMPAPFETAYQQESYHRLPVILPAQTDG